MSQAGSTTMHSRVSSSPTRYTKLAICPATGSACAKSRPASNCFRKTPMSTFSTCATTRHCLKNIHRSGKNLAYDSLQSQYADCHRADIFHFAHHDLHRLLLKTGESPKSRGRFAKKS